jgi:hypothetical protein
MDASEIPTTALGLYQYIIATLLGVISALGGANVWQYKAADSINKARLTERDHLNKTLSDVNATLNNLIETSKRRNEVMDKLGELMSQVSVALKLLTDRLEMQHERANKDLEKAIEVTETLADAVRVVASKVEHGFIEIKAKI